MSNLRIKSVKFIKYPLTASIPDLPPSASAKHGKNLFATSICYQNIFMTNLDQRVVFPDAGEGACGQHIFRNREEEIGTSVYLLSSFGILHETPASQATRPRFHHLRLQFGRVRLTNN